MQHATIRFIYGTNAKLNVIDKVPTEGEKKNSENHSTGTIHVILSGTDDLDTQCKMLKVP